jgi:transcriptional regulator with XRE-family HTH domain
LTICKSVNAFGIIFKKKFLSLIGVPMNEAECREILSANLKRYRSRLHLSQMDLALDLGISPNFLSDVERCKKWVSPHTLALLAEALHIEVFELFKPEKDLPDDVDAILARCFEDISLGVRKNVGQSVAQIFTQRMTQNTAQFIAETVGQSVKTSVEKALGDVKERYSAMA